MGKHYKKIKEVDLQKKLIAHASYLHGDKLGERLDLANHDLRDHAIMLNGHNLALADFTGTCCVSVNFSRCSLEGTDFAGANLRRANFVGTSHVKEANWKGATTVGTYYSNVPDAVREMRVKAKVQAASKRKALVDDPTTLKPKVVAMTELDKWLVKFGSWAITVDDEPVSYKKLPKHLFICTKGMVPRLDNHAAQVWIRATRAQLKVREMENTSPALELVTRDGVPLPPT